MTLGRRYKAGGVLPPDQFTLSTGGIDNVLVRGKELEAGHNREIAVVCNDLGNVRLHQSLDDQ